MDDFPLDIPYGEISQWLASRRKLPSDWIKRLREVQLQTTKAFKALPAAFASSYDIEEDGGVDYVTAKKIRDALAQNAERGYFGGLSGEAGTWDKLVKAYEKGQLYLGEAGQRILKNVDYEIPFMKKKIEGLEKRAAELARRRTEHESMASTAAGNFAKECENLGIKGEALKIEIERLGDDVFEAIDKGLEGLKGKDIAEAVTYYRKMRTEIHGIKEDALVVFQKAIDDQVDPPGEEMIKDLSTTERTTTKTMEHSQVMEQIEESLGLEIDWDVVQTEVTGEEVSTTEVPIEWMDDGGIDWDIAVEQSDDAPSTQMPLTEQPSSSVSGIQGRAQNESGNDRSFEASSAALRFVWDKIFRNTLLDDLYELQAFLTVRSTSDASDAVSLLNAEIMHRYDPQESTRLLKILEDLLDHFVGEDVQRRLMIKTSKGFTDRLLGDLMRRSNKEQKWTDAAVQVDQERQTVQLEHSQSNIRLGQLKRETTELKTMVETDISPLFNNRKINVMGKVNTILLTQSPSH